MVLMVRAALRLSADRHGAARPHERLAPLDDGHHHPRRLRLHRIAPPRAAPLAHAADRRQPRGQFAHRRRRRQRARLRRRLLGLRRGARRRRRRRVEQVRTKARQNARAMARFGAKKRLRLPGASHVGDARLPRPRGADAEGMRRPPDGPARLVHAALSGAEVDAVHARTTSYHRKHLVTSAGSRVLNSIQRYACYMTLIAEDERGAPVELTERLSGKGSLADLDLSVEVLAPLLDRAHEHLQRQAPCGRCARRPAHRRDGAGPRRDPRPRGDGPPVRSRHRARRRDDARPARPARRERPGDDGRLRAHLCRRGGRHSGLRRRRGHAGARRGPDRARHPHRVHEQPARPRPSSASRRPAAPAPTTRATSRWSGCATPRSCRARAGSTR